MAMTRKTFIQISGATLGCALTGRFLASKTFAEPNQQKDSIFTSVKIGMVRTKGTYLDKFKLLKSLGYDGVELKAPGINQGQLEEAVKASQTLKFPIHGTVCSTHWKVRLSDKDPGTRQQAIKNLKEAITITHQLGGNSVLLVPGHVTNQTTQDEVWHFSQQGIRACLPLAAKLGIHILIENVWNGFCYTHDGPDNQTADQLKAYLDSFKSPWVGAYFDIGNHQKYGNPADWIRTLGSHIVKLDVKDWSQSSGFCKIGDGDVSWSEVTKALRDIQFSGWCTAEVRGGDEMRLKEIHARLRQCLIT